MEIIKTESIFSVYLEYIKKRKKYTNCFFDIDFMRNEINNNLLYAYKIKNALLLLHLKDNYYWLYYFSDNWEWMDELDILKENYENLIVSIIINDKIENKADYYIWNKYKEKLFKCYIRMRRSDFYVNGTELENAVYATTEDIEDILNNFLENFDKIGDKIMTASEIQQAIDESRILCIKKDNIQGYIIYEDKGKTTYVRNVCVVDEARGLGIGKMLMSDYLRMHKEYKSYTLWCRVDNHIAMRLYKSFGYVEENLMNYIYLI